MTRSQTLAVTHGLTSYAQGLVTEGTAEGLHADLLHLTGAPVPVNSTNFEYAEFDGNASTQTLETKIGENDPEGPEISFGGTTRSDSLDTNGASSPWYPVQNVSDGDILNSVREAARLGTTRMLLSRLSAGVTTINASATAPTAIDLTSAATEVVKLLQAQIDAVHLACGGMAQIHLLWGSSAFREMSNHTKVQARINGGATKNLPSTITLQQVDDLLGMGTKSRLSKAVYNSAARGQTVSNAFLLSNVVYIAAVSTTPSRLDPAAVKLFTGRGDALSPVFWAHNSGTHEKCKWNWQEKVRVTNSAALIKQAFTV